MGGFVPVILVLVIAVGVVAGVYAVWSLVALSRLRLSTSPFLSGEAPTEHAMSRFHVRWYAVSLLFLAFDMEMVFMYPWAVVVSDLGAGAVVEMFAFLGLLLVGVAYAWREGALRWV